ncbi:MAG: LysM peptidoglycan-binding domain-containing protein, partial [Rickettsiales bacterium]
MRIPFTKSTGQTTTPNATRLETPTPNVASNLVAEHIVKPKEYLGVIAKQYGVTVEELKELNALSSNNLSIGQTLKIPVKEQQAVNNVTTVATASNKPIDTKVNPTKTLPVAPSIQKNDPSFEHVVATGETIYSIAKKFNTTTYQITTANNLTSNSLKVGQRLTIKNPAPVGVNTVQQQDTDDAGENMITPTLKGAPSKYGISQLEERGVGVWIEDQDLDPNKMLILHRT